MTPSPEESGLKARSAFEEAVFMAQSAIWDHDTTRDVLHSGTATIDNTTLDFIPEADSPFGAPVKCILSPGDDARAQDADMLMLLDTRHVSSQRVPGERPEAALVKDLLAGDPNIAYLLVGKEFGQEGEGRGFKALRADEVVVWGRSDTTIGSRFGLTPDTPSLVSRVHAELTVAGDASSVSIVDKESRYHTTVMTRRREALDDRGPGIGALVLQGQVQRS